MNTMKRTYDAYINDIYKQGLSLSQLNAYKNKGYNVFIIASYVTSENDYNTIEIKNRNYY